MIILPRQARDKRRESTQKRDDALSAGEGVQRAGFAEVFRWWWQYDRTSAAQRDAASSSNGPGTGALPETEEEAAARLQRRGGRRSSRKVAAAGEEGDPDKTIRPRLVADTSVLPYCDPQRWGVPTSVDGVRRAGADPPPPAPHARARLVCCGYARLFPIESRKTLQRSFAKTGSGQT